MVRFALLLAISLLGLAGAALQFGVAQKHLSVEQRRQTSLFLLDFFQLLEAAADVPISLDRVDEIERSRTKAVVWLDARPEAERNFSWIPNARLAAGFSADTMDPNKHLVVVYDTDGGLALAKAKQLNAEKGWHAAVHSLRGGTLAWAFAGRPFQSKKGYVRELRVPSALWNLAPDDYKITWK